jgi:hypothetical protein
LIGTHSDWPDAAYLLELSEELAHALVLVLSRLPAARRREFADLFYAQRQSRGTELPADARGRLALGAAVVLKVVGIANYPEIQNERTLDLLRGAAQKDDLTRTPGPAAEEFRRSMARLRLDLESEDSDDAGPAAALAVAEVLDPSSDVVDFNEVLARCAWAAVETWDQQAVLGFLLEVDRTVGGGVT